MPNEPALSVALKVDPSLMEHAFKEKIVLVTPSTFYTTLKTVAHIWSRSEDQQALSDAIDIANKFMQQSRLLINEVGELKSGLTDSVTAYNKMLKRLNGTFIDPVVKLTGYASLAEKGRGLERPDAVQAQLNDLTAIELTAEQSEELEDRENPAE